MTRLIWLPPLLWMAMIIWFSTGYFSDVNTGKVLMPLLQWIFPWADAAQIRAVHFIVRKAAHIGEYAVLAALWYIALRRERLWLAPQAAWTAFSVAIVWAFVDELHQAMEPSRSASIADIGFDTAGAMIGSFVARQDWRHTTRLMAAAAALVIAVNVAGRLGSRTLWITLPIFAALLALGWRRSGRRGENAGQIL
jgi:VanZ family protein